MTTEPNTEFLRKADVKAWLDLSESMYQILLESGHLVGEKTARDDRYGKRLFRKSEIKRLMKL